MSGRRTELDAGAAVRRMVGRPVSAVEFVAGDAGGYVVLRVGSVTLYADAPVVYDDAAAIAAAPPTGIGRRAVLGADDVPVDADRPPGTSGSWGEA